MNHRHKGVLLDECHQTTGCPRSDNIKLVGQNGQSTYVNACVLAFLLPWLSKSLETRVNKLNSISRLYLLRYITTY